MRLLSRLLAAALALQPMLAMVPVHAAVFSDVSASTQYRVAIEALKADGVIAGNPDGTFRPLNRINRAEFLKIILEARDEENRVTSDTSCFPDVNGDDWFAQYVCLAKAESIVAGYPDGMFHPERDISFVEASKILTLAFEQNVNTYAPDWYEPYVRALEGSKAIPRSIDALERKITRAETAEMLWRIVNKKTDQASIGYLNVKYPDISINTASDDVQRPATCRDLQAFTQEQGRSNGMMYYERGMMMEDAATMPPSPAPAAAESKTMNFAVPQTGGGADGDFSRTNVQVEGVDEADIVKTDGTYLYIVRNDDRSTVKVVKAVPGSDLKEVASIGFDNDTSAQELYVDGSTLIVIGQRGYSYGGPVIMEKRMAPGVEPSIAPGEYYPGMYYVQRTDVRIFDVSNPASPTLKRTLSFDGNQLSSRRINDKLYLVVQQPMYWGRPMPLDTVKASDIVPQFEDSRTGKTLPVTECDRIAIIPHVPSPQYMTVAVIPTKNANAEVKTSAVLGSAENMYSSLQNLYLSSTQWNYSWDSANPNPGETTHLYRFAFTDAGVELKAQGDVPGRILNQFSMDENGSNFRVATTKSGIWREDGQSNSTNNLYVLDASLEQLGKIEEIAPREQIYSVRFVGDRAYMVTFRTIDPLFVIDLKDARNPKILGKLKIPGYSNYLHPYDENHIIGFGKDAVESKEGNFAWQQGMKVAIFDVTDVENPEEMHKLEIGDRGTESPLLHNHKALLFEKDRNLLAFPITITQVTQLQRQQQGPSAYGSPIFQGAHVYDISLSKGFVLRGTVTHYDDSDVYDKAGDYWYSAGRDIERILRIGSSLLTISPAGVRSHDEKDVKLQGKMEFTK